MWQGGASRGEGGGGVGWDPGWGGGADSLGDEMPVLPPISHLQHKLLPEVGDGAHPAVAVVHVTHADGKTATQAASRR